MSSGSVRSSPAQPITAADSDRLSLPPSADTAVPGSSLACPLAPWQLLSRWLAEAVAAAEKEPTAMALATTSTDSAPDVRFVLCKQVHQHGVRFFTNLGSVKARHILDRPEVALAMHWPGLGRQARMRGKAEQLPDPVADEYFQTRARASQIGAWASRQSQHMIADNDLRQAVAHFTAKFDGRTVPRPSHWSGFDVLVSSWEFWEQGDARLHRRWRYDQCRDGWRLVTLYP